MKQQQITTVLVIAVLAVFNTVDHDLLPDVLQGKFGTTNTVLKWYKNYLKPKKVCINGSYSSEWLILIRIHSNVYLFNCCASTLSKIVPDLLALNCFAVDIQ